MKLDEYKTCIMEKCEVYEVLRIRKKINQPDDQL